MKTIYTAVRKKMDRENAMMVSLLIHIIGWFFPGLLLGILLAMLWRGSVGVVSCGMTLGGCSSLLLGYVWGYIRLLKIADQ